MAWLAVEGTLGTLAQVMVVPAFSERDLEAHEGTSGAHFTPWTRTAHQLTRPPVLGRGTRSA